MKRKKDQKPRAALELGLEEAIQYRLNNGGKWPIRSDGRAKNFTGPKRSLIDVEYQKRRNQQQQPQSTPPRPQRDVKLIKVIEATKFSELYMPEEANPILECESCGTMRRGIRGLDASLSKEEPFLCEMVQQSCTNGQSSWDLYGRQNLADGEIVRRQRVLTGMRWTEIRRRNTLAKDQRKLDGLHKNLRNDAKQFMVKLQAEPTVEGRRQIFYATWTIPSPTLNGPGKAHNADIMFPSIGKRHHERIVDLYGTIENSYYYHALVQAAHGVTRNPELVFGSGDVDLRDAVQILYQVILRGDRTTGAYRATGNAVFAKYGFTSVALFSNNGTPLVGRDRINAVCSGAIHRAASITSTSTCYREASINGYLVLYVDLSGVEGQYAEQTSLRYVKDFFQSRGIKLANHRLEAFNITTIIENRSNVNGRSRRSANVIHDANHRWRLHTKKQFLAVMFFNVRAGNITDYDFVSALGTNNYGFDFNLRKLTQEQRQDTGLDFLPDGTVTTDSYRG